MSIARDQRQIVFERRGRDPDIILRNRRNSLSQPRLYLPVPVGSHFAWHQQTACSHELMDVPQRCFLSFEW